MEVSILLLTVIGQCVTYLVCRFVSMESEFQEYRICRRRSCDGQNSMLLGYVRRALFGHDHPLLEDTLSHMNDIKLNESSSSHTYPNVLTNPHIQNTFTYI